MGGTKTRLMLYKFTKVIIAILIIPTLIFGVFCTVVLSNTKTNGIPSIFGFNAVQIPNNDFYNSEAGLYKAGEYQIFHSVKNYNYKIGDMISYYDVSEPVENHIIIEDIEWNEDLSQFANSANNTQFFEKSYNLKQTTSYELSINNSFKNNNALEFEENSNSEINLGKIKNIGVAKDTEGNDFIICLIAESPQDYVFKHILAVNIIGCLIESSPFIINLFLFSSTTLSFVVMLLLPCALLIIFQVTNLSLVARQAKEEKIAKKKLIREIELKNQQEEFLTAKPLPTESEKEFAGLLKGGGGGRLDSSDLMHKKTQVYSKEELENIRKGLLSNKKPKFSFDSDFEEDEYFDKLQKMSEKGQQLNKEKELDKTKKTSEKIVGLRDNKIPEDIIKIYGMDVKEGEKGTSQKTKSKPISRTSSFERVQPEIKQSSPLKTDFKNKNQKQDFELPKNFDFGDTFGFKRADDSTQQKTKIKPISSEKKKSEKIDLQNLDANLFDKFGFKNKSDLNKSDSDN